MGDAASAAVNGTPGIEGQYPALVRSVPRKDALMVSQIFIISMVIIGLVAFAALALSENVRRQ